MHIAVIGKGNVGAFAGRSAESAHDTVELAPTLRLSHGRQARWSWQHSIPPTKTSVIRSPSGRQAPHNAALIRLHLERPSSGGRP